MANHKSAEKRARQTVVRTERNKVRKSKTKSIIKKIREAIASGDKATALGLLPQAQSLLARLGKSGFVRDNNASRRTGRLAKQISKLS